MSEFIIFGAGNKRSGICGSVFRDVYDGRIMNASYSGIGALFPPRRLLYHALTNRNVRRLILPIPRLRAALDKLASRVLSANQHISLRKLDRLILPGKAFTLIFVPGTRLELLPVTAVEELRSARPDCRLVFYLIDGLERMAAHCGLSVDDVLMYLAHYDAVFSYDHLDAAAHPQLLRFVDIPLWHAQARAEQDATYDLYFCGRNKLREELLFRIQQRLTRGGLKCRIELAGGEKVKYKDSGIIHSAWIPYESYIKELCEANCLLEVLAPDNKEVTLRYKEAVIYNKKLLTNYTGIRSLPYYDPRWMRVFGTELDIDLDWLRRVEPVDYGYKGDFRVEHFLDRVDELLASAQDETKPCDRSLG